MVNRLFLFMLFLAQPVTAWAADDDIDAMMDVGKMARGLVLTFVWIILAIGVIAVAVFIIRHFMYKASLKNIKTNAEQLQDEIKEHVHKGDFVSAAAVYERIDDPENAARMYIRGNQFLKAGSIYEALGKPEKAIDLYIKGGESLKAASLHIKLKNYYEAAKIFKNKGDRIRAAQALEMFGNRLGAAKEYKEAGEYLKAAKLYKDLNLYPETAEMFRLLLENKDVDESTAGQFYMYGTFLALTDRNDDAADVFRRVHAFDPAFRDVAQRLELLQPGEVAVPQAQPEPEPETPSSEAVVTDAAQAHAEMVEQEVYDPDDIEALIEQEISKRDGVPPPSSGPETAQAPAGTEGAGDTSSLQRETTLKNMIRSGSLEPRYAMKLWVEVLRKLKVMHDRSQFIGVLSPHTIFIDMENNIRIEPPPVPPSVYMSPEFTEGSSADAQTDIYSAGVLLYEMVTGSLDDFGVKNPSQINKDIPEWIDEFVLRCTENEREHRYRNLDDIYSKLLELRDKM